MADDPLAFGIDLTDVRTRLEGLGYFLSVTDVLEASEALDGTVTAAPPAAFVGVTSETAQGQPGIGSWSQRISVEVSILFVESAARMDRRATDQMEQTRRAVMRQMVGWQPAAAQRAFNFRRYRIVSVGGGLAWGEVTMEAPYLFTLT
jgi:hypothetical protein